MDPEHVAAVRLDMLCAMRMCQCVIVMAYVVMAYAVMAYVVVAHACGINNCLTVYKSPLPTVS